MDDGAGRREILFGGGPNESGRRDHTVSAETTPVDSTLWNTLHRYYEVINAKTVEVYGLDGLVNGSDYRPAVIVRAIIQHSQCGWEDWRLVDVRRNSDSRADYEIYRAVRGLQEGEIP